MDKKEKFNEINISLKKLFDETVCERSFINITRAETSVIVEQLGIICD